MRHKPSREPSSLVYSLFPNDYYLTFFLISVKMDLENKVIGLQFEPERSISNHNGFFQDSSDERKRHVWCKCRKCSTMKTKQQCQCCQEVKSVHDFILQGIFILSQAKILSELQKQSHRGVL